MRFIIDKSFRKNDKRIARAIKDLNNATPKSVIEIVLFHNNGGSTLALENLVDAIDNSKAYRIHLIFSGFAVSAAAYLFAYYTYHKKNTNVSVKVKGDLCLVFHRPRTLTPTLGKGYVTFASKLKQPYNRKEQYLVNITNKFDSTFSSMMLHHRVIGANIPQNVESVYDFDGDVQIWYTGGKYR